MSDADSDEFVCVKIDVEILSEDNYRAESDSTVITVNSDFLNGLSNGQDTVSIVSERGTASTQFIDAQDEYFKRLSEQPADNEIGGNETTEEEPFDIVKYANDIINGKVEGYLPNDEVSGNE